MRGAGAALLLALIAVGVAPAAAQPDERVEVIAAEGLSLRGSLSDPTLAALARAGGIGLMAYTRRPSAFEGDLEEITGAVHAGLHRTAPTDVGDVVRSLLSTDRDVPVVVFVLGTRPPEGEHVSAVIMASGLPSDLLSATGAIEGLTSSTTRREGLVADVDVIRTLAGGLLVAGDLVGSPIRVEGEAPTALHERYVEWRRSAGPVGLGVLAFALTALAVALVLLVVPWNPGGRVRAAVALWVLFSVALLVALVPASLLPDLRPLPAAFGVVVIGAILAAAAILAARRSPTLEVALVAAVGLGLVVLDGALGWPTGVTPLLGGSALEGVRFFGLGNPYAGIVLSGALLTAALLRPWPGVVLLAAAGLFAGLPFLGADLGGGVTLFAVAAAWYGLRVRGRLAVREWALVGAAAVAGLALLVIAHRTLPPGATHVARAFEGAGPGDVLGVFLHRLALNLRATTEVPAAWLAVLGLPAGLVVAWRGPGRFATLAREPVWRDAAIALALGGMIGYVVNDTYGMAAVTFTFLAGAVLVPALRWTSG